MVRVRPAFAGEGRYFVRVPEGTNAARGEESLVRMLEAGAGKQPDEEEEEAMGEVPRGRGQGQGGGGARNGADRATSARR